MAQLERTRRSTDSSKTSPTFEQLLKVDETYWSPHTTSPAPGMSHGHGHGHGHGHEECLSPNNNKKSVLSMVKERAKKLKHTLSGRKNVHETDLTDDSTSNISSADHNNLDDDDYEYDDEPVDDPEYLGAPMYESEAAPDNLKENARQHPRAVPVVSENHRMPNITKPSEPETAFAAMSDATHKIASKFTGLTIAPSEAQQTAAANPGYEAKNIREKTGNLKAYTGCSSPQTYDKGVSVKEYFMNKLEPGEDERALSQAITEAISPRKVTNNTGVVEKVKDAVSFLWKEMPVSNSMGKPTSPSSGFSASTKPIPNASSVKPLYTATYNSSPQFSRSLNANEGLEEENHGKILQTN
ncbi:hypothetical protein CASFOL_002911 [Castilleja foliolosa]|uniref:Uncharacterized protein n=1 Tax=Castilleja foliolosa TaxID=1961234 RepID=A0ABD3EJC4_9LAMI